MPVERFQKGQLRQGEAWPIAQREIRAALGGALGEEIVSLCYLVTTQGDFLPAFREGGISRIAMATVSRRTRPAEEYSGGLRPWRIEVFAVSHTLRERVNAVLLRDVMPEIKRLFLAGATVGHVAAKHFGVDRSFSTLYTFTTGPDGSTMEGKCIHHGANAL